MIGDLVGEGPVLRFFGIGIRWKTPDVFILQN